MPAVAVAVSGGRDSIALLHCTARAARPLGLRVLALHVHHGLNPAADAWQRQLAAQCRRWAHAGLPVALQVHRLPDAPPPGASVEAWARRARYAALARMAHAAGCTLVLLAHHRRDQAETVLLQALRGGGARGLSAMPSVAERDGLRWARPWLDQPREAIEAYVARHRLRHVHDDSNDDPRFDRNRLRLQAWPALVAAFPQAEVALADAARRAQGEAAVLAALAEADGAAQPALDVAAWQGLAPSRRDNLLRHWLARATGRGAPERLVQRLASELPTARTGRWPAPGGELRLYRGRLDWITDAPALPVVEPVVLDLRRPGRHALPGGAGWLQVRACRDGGIALARLAAVALRPRQGGERFQAHAAGPARALKKQYQAAAVPAWARQGPLLWAADGALLFVPGLGVDARARAGHGEPQRSVSWLPAAAG